MSVSNRLQTKLQTKRDAEEKRARLRKGCIQVAAGLVGFGFVVAIASASGGSQSRLPLYTPEPYVSKFNTSHTYAEPAVEEKSEVVETLQREITVDTPLEVGTCGGVRCGPDEARQQSEDYWTQQLLRDAQSRAECRAGEYSRDYCNRWFPDWETRFD